MYQDEISQLKLLV